MPLYKNDMFCLKPIK